MTDEHDDKTEWIYCRNIKGECSGLNPSSKVVEKVPKVIKVHGQEVRGWMVKVVQEKTEGHVDIDLTKNYSDE
jgi:hypothetical protein